MVSFFIHDKDKFAKRAFSGSVASVEKNQGFFLLLRKVLMFIFKNWSNDAQI